MTQFTVPGMTEKEGAKVAEILQKQLSRYNDLHLTLKHVHWNVVGPNFIGVHEMIDPQVELVRGYADEVAERIATLGASPKGTPGAIISDRSWDDYSLERDTVAAHLAALDLVYDGVIEDTRKGIEETEEPDPITNDMLIGHSAELEKFQWFVRAHLESAGGKLAHEGKSTEKGAAAAAVRRAAARRSSFRRIRPAPRGAGLIRLWAVSASSASSRTGRSASSSLRPNRYGYARPAIAAPTSGASQNAHSCAGAPSPLKNATPVLRAGFTEVFEIGIEIRWIRVSVSPIDNPAKPCGARSSVEPRITSRKMPVSTTSAMSTAHSE